MNSCLFLLRILVVAIIVSGSNIKSLAQSSSGANPPQGDVVLIKLTQPIYPPLARQARITGDVELTIEVRKDGTVQFFYTKRSSLDLYIQTYQALRNVT